MQKNSLPGCARCQIIEDCELFLAGSSVKDSLRLPLHHGDSGSEEGGCSPAGSPRPDRGPLSLIKSTHRALLASGSLLASVGLGRCLDVSPKVPPRTNPPSLEECGSSFLDSSSAKPPVREPPVVDDLITFAASEPLPKPLLDLALRCQELKPLPVAPPSAAREHGTRPDLSPEGREPGFHPANGDAGFESSEQRSDRRRRSSPGLHGSQLGG